MIWNEPDIEPDVYGTEFAGSVEDYYQLVKVAYLVMKAEHPSTRIHLGGLTFWHDEVAGRQQYLARLLEVAATDPSAQSHGHYFDAVPLHLYFRPETIPGIVAEMKAILGAHRLTKPIWINETNAAPNNDPAWPVTRH